MNRIDFNDVLRIACTIIGAIVATLEPAAPYLLICTLIVFADCLTAWHLSRRVRKTHPEKASKDAAKFQSQHAGRIFVTLIKIYSLIILVHLVEIYIANSLPFSITKSVAGGICFWQFWSILENESSCNNAKWAKVMQKYLIDKTERHFDIDLSDLKPKTNDSAN